MLDQMPAETSAAAKQLDEAILATLSAEAGLPYPVLAILDSVRHRTQSRIEEHALLRRLGHLVQMGTIKQDRDRRSGSPRWRIR
ncbi:MAG: hypothetical protein WC080_03915 [Patescibacteria group bacterium]|jgi:hypothetical protein